MQRVLRQVRPDLVLIARLFDAYEAVIACKAAGMAMRLIVTLDAHEAGYIHDLNLYSDWVDLGRTCGQLLARTIKQFTTLPPERRRHNSRRRASRESVVEHRDERPLRWGYVGRLVQTQKRIFDLVDVLAGLTVTGVPYTCRIAGTGAEEAELRRRLTQRGLDSFVIFHGWRSLDQLYQQVYPQLDVLLHFSPAEGITIAPREAMAHGVVPVVSRFLGCLSEGQFVHEHNALTFAVGDINGAIAAVRRLHQDRPLLRRLAVAAMQSREGSGSEQGALQTWAHALQRLLEQPIRRSSTPPRLPWAACGRLERWGLSPAWAETLRACLGRKSLHIEPGGEWPHASGLLSAARLHEINAFAEQQERDLDRERLAKV